MHPQLLRYYNEELIYMRESAGEFARTHPKIAGRLGIHGHEVADPYVERLIEAFSFMSARMRIKLDAEFPRFTQRLLEVVYPNYVSPTPSMTVVQLHPLLTEGDFTRGFRVPRGTAMHAKVPPGEVTSCQFRTTQEVTLWPLEICDARLTGVPPDIPSPDRYLAAHIQVEGSLRLRLRLRGELRFCDLQGLDRLPVYLCGQDQVASHLFELLHAGAVAAIVGAPGRIDREHHVVSTSALVHEGLAAEDSMLPLQWNTWFGHNQLHEYFACPARFYFFALQGLAPGLARIRGQEAEIVVLLTRTKSMLEAQVDASQFALHCTPAINLFEHRTDRLEVPPSGDEVHLVPDRSRPLDFEVYSVAQLIGQKARSTECLPFRPLFQTLNHDEGNHGRYFSIRREPRLVSDSAGKYGRRTGYVGTEAFLSLVDQHEAPYAEDLRYLSVQAWVTNRDLPLLISRNGFDDLRTAESLPVERIGLVRPASAPQPPFAEGELAWRLIRQLGFNYLPLHEMNEREGAQALRDMLRLFVFQDDAAAQQQLSGLMSSHIRAVTRRLPGSGPLMYGRGVECTLTVDEDGFSGTSPYLFGLVMAHYLTRHVAINTFAQTRLHSLQRGEVACWPALMGRRGGV